MLVQSDLDILENQSIYIIREAYFNVKNVAMLWSMGKDSTVMLWLVRKAFMGKVPFPVIHIDTTFKIPKMIEYRDSKAKEWNLDLIVGKNDEALKEGMNYKKGRLVCCEKLKTEGLQQIMKKYKFQCLLLGIRGDEEASRSKERIFSPRDQEFEWLCKKQPPEIWDNFLCRVPKNGHLRAHPILRWTEIDVWRYIKRENIPVIDLYFSKNGRRYRSIGCECCTSTIESDASTIDDIIYELEHCNTSERSNRLQDQEEEYAMQKLRVRGYM